jgi:hypothetical protein
VLRTTKSRLAATGVGVLDVELARIGPDGNPRDYLRFLEAGAELRDLLREWFHSAHVCDAPAEVPATQASLIHTARFERLFPGEGGIDLDCILAALPPGIPYALEIPHAERVAQFGAKEHARLTLATARHRLDHAHARTDAA